MHDGEESGRREQQSSVEGSGHHEQQSGAEGSGHREQQSGAEGEHGFAGPACHGLVSRNLVAARPVA